MFTALKSTKVLFAVLAVLIAAGSVQADDFDTSRYIGLDEIEPGMLGYTRTVYRGTEIEDFPIEVIDVVRDFRPGQDAILVMGTDERFIHTGPVGGVSGSPVYIDDRIAGALAFGWTYSKDPLYGVTPIGEMLQVKQFQAPPGGAKGLSFDFSKPLDLSAIYEQLPQKLSAARPRFPGAEALKKPLIMSGVSDRIGDQMEDMLGGLGLIPVTGPIGSTGAGDENTALEAGSVMTIPLVSGDMNFTTLGTVTDVDGDEVYAFGHSFLGEGEAELPMATGKVHTVVATVPRSFKLGSPIETVGAVTLDKSAAVYGQIGKEAYTVPLRVKVDRFDAPKVMEYDCRIAHHRVITPVLMQVAISGATTMIADLPHDHRLYYSGKIGIKGHDPVEFENVSTTGLIPAISDAMSALTLLMNNPYDELKIEQLDFSVELLPDNIEAALWSVEVDNTTVRPGGRIKVDVILEAYLADRKHHSFTITVPENTEPGSYRLMILGSRQYEQFIRQQAPQRFIAYNTETLLSSLKNLMSINRKNLYCVLALKPDGITIERSELPYLPATRGLVMQDKRRSVNVRPYMRWIEESITTENIIIDQKEVEITVEK